MAVWSAVRPGKDGPGDLVLTHIFGITRVELPTAIHGRFSPKAIIGPSFTTGDAYCHTSPLHPFPPPQAAGRGDSLAIYPCSSTGLKSAYGGKRSVNAPEALWQQRVDLWVETDLEIRPIRRASIMTPGLTTLGMPMTTCGGWPANCLRFRR